MTYSNCSAGNVGGGNNLKTDYYTAFADYLTEVVKYYHDSLGVSFRTLSPMNEPTNAWMAGGSQEGCSIWETSNQSSLINEVYNKLSAKGMLGYCTISAIEGSHVDQTVTGINALISDGRILKISQINTHTYGGSQHALLKTIADQQVKKKRRLVDGLPGLQGLQRTTPHAGTRNFFGACSLGYQQLAGS